MSDPRLRVAYIVGTKNCGSTLLDTLIGQAEGTRSLGEVGGFFRYVGEVDCDCGQRAASCGVCRSVTGGLSSEHLLAMQRLFPLVRKERRIYWTVLPTRNRQRYAELSDRVFALIADSTNNHMMVDSSKNIGRAAALAHDSQLEVKIVHLIRDGRGFLVSRRGRSPIEGLRYSAAWAQYEWIIKNLAIWLLLRPRLKKDTYFLCRYEDLVADLKLELARIGEFLEIDLNGVAQRVSGSGVPREHVYEPARDQNYKLVRLNSSKLKSQKLSGPANLLYWAGGGFISKLWRYDFSQSYIDESP